MGYLDTAKRTTRRRLSGKQNLSPPEPESATLYAVNAVNAKSPAVGRSEGVLSHKISELPEHPGPRLGEYDDTGPEWALLPASVRGRITRQRKAALVSRVMELGAEHGYPEMSLGEYRFRNRKVSSGLFAGKGKWEHQTDFFGKRLLQEVIRRLEATT